MKSVRALTRFAFFVLAVLLPGRVFCEATMQQILTNGPTDKRINIVLLSEGYTATELDQFAAPLVSDQRGLGGLGQSALCWDASTETPRSS